jgi:hypothetical protein
LEAHLFPDMKFPGQTHTFRRTAAVPVIVVIAADTPYSLTGIHPGFRFSEGGIGVEAVAVEVL